MSDKPDKELFIDEGAIKAPTWGELDATPNDALRELRDEYRGRIKRYEDKYPQAALAYAEVTTDLTELIDDE